MVDGMTKLGDRNRFRSRELRVEVRGARLPGVTRLRLWTDERSTLLTVVGEIIQRFGSGTGISLELLEQGAVDAIVTRDIRVTHLEGLQTPIALDVSASDLARLLPHLAPYPFTGWVGVGSGELEFLLRESRNRDRETRMPPLSLYLIFSLYDDNVELRAKGLSHEDILNVVKGVAMNLGVDVVE